MSVGDAVLIVPGGVDELRSRLLTTVGDELWSEARAALYLDAAVHLSAGSPKLEAALSEEGLTFVVVPT